MINILIADDEQTVRWAFDKALRKHNYNAFLAANGQEALDIIRKENIDLAILDVKMPGLSGLDVLSYIKENDLPIFCIIITAYGDMDMTIAAMKLGAYDYITKPFDIKEVIALISKALEGKKVSEEKFCSLKPEARVNSLASEDKGNIIIGNSRKMQEIFKLIGKIADRDVTVLITGESGAGKELIAKTIHKKSKRGKNSFCAVNCTAIPDTLMESEFFGHEKGSFTGATNRRVGKFESAQGGTLFLDEIGDMKPELQAKLLRVIQEREFTRVGGNVRVETDVRIVAATNMDLEKAIEEGRFRQELYYRLNVITIEIPPLRERREDIPELVKYFIKKLNEKYNENITKIEDSAMEMLINYNWPGNIRELENTLETAFALNRGGTILLEDLPISNKIKKSGKGNLSEELKLILEKIIDSDFHFSFEKGELPEDLYNKILSYIEPVLILKILKETKNNQVKSAKLLGITRNTLRTKMSKYKLN